MNFLTIEPQFVNCLFLIFLINPFVYWLSFFFYKNQVLAKIANFNSILSLFLLCIYLSLRWFIGHYFPISNLYESLLFLTWFLTFVLTIGERSTKNNIFGVIISPITLLLISFATLVLPNAMQKINPLVPALQSNWLMMHVTMMLASYAVLLVGTLLSALYLSIYEIFKKKLITGKIFNSTYKIKALKEQTLRLYCMELIDLWSYRLITLGFPILTIGIISGAVWANEAWGSYWSWDPKETWALITWLTFSIYLHTRLIQKASKEKSAKVASVGFLVIWICYLGVNFLGQGLHSYGWLN